MLGLLLKLNTITKGHLGKDCDCRYFRIALMLCKDEA